MAITTAAAVVRMGGSSCAMTYEVRAADGALAQGSAALVFVDDQLRPMPIPAATREAIAAFEGIPARSGPGHVQAD